MQKATFIELNGTRYNAANGQLVLGKDIPKPRTVTATPRTNGRVIDGVIRPSSVNTLSPLLTTPQARPKPIPPLRHHAKQPRLKRLLNSRRARHREHAKTLMRSTVAKPALATVRQLSSVARPLVSHKAQTTPPIRPLVSEQFHYSSVSRSPHISHFGQSKQHPPLQPTVAQVPVRPVPSSSYRTPPPPTTHHQSSGDLDFLEAIDRAANHPEPVPNKRVTGIKQHSKLIGASAMGLLLIVLGGFFAVHNIPSLNIRLASHRAGFEAHLPAYQPSGFVLGASTAAPGQVILNFQAIDGRAGRSFKLIQQPSDWNDETLVASYVQPSDPAYQSIHTGNQTIYRYNDTDASWVDGTTWYILKGVSSLSDDQLVRLATSL